MRRTLRLSALLLSNLAIQLALVAPLCATDGSFRPAGSPGDLQREQATVTNRDGVEVELERGTLLVQESRLDPQSPAISIPFYRLPSTAEEPEAPIFILAGGPGSSWIDRFEHPENFAEVEFYRTMGDVVIFDQRGAGHSMPELDCNERDRLPLDQPLQLNLVAASQRSMSERCRQRWIAKGVNLAAYNTRENVSDVLALQRALGYETMKIVGGSYGSHLGLALMREAPERIERALLYGIEGPDHTWDDPDGRLAALERIAGAIEADVAFADKIPAGGLIEALNTVIGRLVVSPVTMTIPGDNGEHDQTVVIDAHLVRRFAGLQAGRRSRPHVWPEFILDLYQGDYANVARGAVALRNIRIDRPMHYMMDCASGISPDRARRYSQSAAADILGPINFEYQEVCDAWQARDLGDHFRAAVTSDIPTLLVHGTWDTSAPIENAREVVATLSNGHLIEVVGGNHGALYNLYEHWPPAHERIGAFLRGEQPRLPLSVTMRALDFPSNP